MIQSRPLIEARSQTRWLILTFSPFFFFTDAFVLLDQHIIGFLGTFGLVTYTAGQMAYASLL